MSRPRLSNAEWWDRIRALLGLDPIPGVICERNRELTDRKTEAERFAEAWAPATEAARCTVTLTEPATSRYPAPRAGFIKHR